MLVLVDSLLVEAEAVRLAQRRQRYLDGEELGEQRREVDLGVAEHQPFFLVVVEFVEDHGQLRRLVEHRVDELGLYVDLDLGQAAAAVQDGHASDRAVDDEVVVAPRVEPPDVPLERTREAQTIGLEQVLGWNQKSLCLYLYFAAWRVVKQGRQV